MPNVRSEPITARLTPAERLRVEAAAQIEGVSRSAYLRRAATERAAQDLQGARSRPDQNRDRAEA